MSEKEKNLHDEEEEVEIVTLSDEDGNETDFQILQVLEIEDGEYYALLPDKEDAEEYYIVRGETDEKGEKILSTIDDDDEFEKISDIFNDMFFGEINYDAK